MAEWAGRGEREESISLFEGLTEKYAGTNVKFIYAEGCDLLTDDSSKFAEAIATARRADIVLRLWANVSTGVVRRLAVRT